MDRKELEKQIIELVAMCYGKNADDLTVDSGAWTCGKEQSVPVSCGIPTVLIGNLTVGGE